MHSHARGFVGTWMQSSRAELVPSVRNRHTPYVVRTCSTIRHFTGWRSPLKRHRKLFEFTQVPRWEEGEENYPQFDLRADCSPAAGIKRGSRVHIPVSTYNGLIQRTDFKPTCVPPWWWDAAGSTCKAPVCICTCTYRPLSGKTPCAFRHVQTGFQLPTGA